MRPRCDMCERRQNIRWAVFAVAVSIFPIGCAESYNKQHSTLVVTDKESIRFGTLRGADPSNVWERTLLLTNSTTQAVHLSTPRTTCGCATATMNLTELQPGASARLVVALRSLHAPARVFQSVIVTASSAAPRQVQVLRIPISAQIVPRVYTQPRELNIEDVATGVPLARTFALFFSAVDTAARRQRPQITSHVSTAELRLSELAPVSTHGATFADDRFAGTLTIVPDIHREGQRREFVTFETSDGTYRMPVTWSQPIICAARPSRIHFSLTPSELTCERRVVIGYKERPDRRPEILSTFLEGGAVRSHVKATPDPTTFMISATIELEVETPREDRTPRLLGGVIVVDTGLTAKPRLEIPIHGVVCNADNPGA